METPGYDISFKVAILGDPGCLKSIFINFEIGEEEPRDTSMDTVILTKDKLYEIDNIVYKVTYFQVPHHERFLKVASRICTGVAGIIHTFDVSNESSFELMKEWHQGSVKDRSPDTIVQVLVGNRANDDPVEVDSRESVEYAKQNNMPYYETLSTHGDGISDAFSGLIQSVAQSIPTSLEPSLLIEQRVKLEKRLIEDVGYQLGLYDDFSNK